MGGRLGQPGKALNPMYGRTHTEEIRAHMSNSQKLVDRSADYPLREKSRGGCYPSPSLPPICNKMGGRQGKGVTTSYRFIDCPSVNQSRVGLGCGCYLSPPPPHSV